jgi:hypothetical protein
MRFRNIRAGENSTGHGTLSCWMARPGAFVNFAFSNFI